MKNKNTEKIEFLKIVYFDEAAAQDYVDVTNGGRLDWSTQENKEKIAKIVGRKYPATPRGPAGSHGR